VPHQTSTAARCSLALSFSIIALQGCIDMFTLRTPADPFVRTPSKTQDSIKVPVSHGNLDNVPALSAAAARNSASNHETYLLT
jgi:hypothetical protein